jgi:hypothetical protein
MTVIRYSAGKLMGLALVLGALAALFLWMLVAPETFLFVHGRYGFLIRFIAENAWVSGGLFALFGGVTAVASAMAIGDRTALALGPEGVEVRTTLGRHRAGWDRVAGIRIESAGRTAGKNETLTVRLRQDLGEKVLRLSTGLLEQSRWEINRLLEGLGRPGVGGEAGPGVVVEAAPAMDYDAVIARHLAARRSGGGEERGQVQANVAGESFPRPPGGGGFGRKGL